MQAVPGPGIGRREAKQRRTNGFASIHRASTHEDDVVAEACLPSLGTGSFGGETVGVRTVGALLDAFRAARGVSRQRAAAMLTRGTHLDCKGLT